MTCTERQNLILLYAAGALEGDEQDQLRAHLATGCPQCAGALAEAEAALAQLPLTLDVQAPPPDAKKTLLRRIADDARKSPQADSYKIGPKPREWDRIILPAALAAVLAVAVTLTAVWRFRPIPQAPKPQTPDSGMMLAVLQATIDKMQTDLTSANAQLDEAKKQLADATQHQDELASMKLAQLTGSAQPDALGRVFIDTQKGQWYFFTSGMKPAGPDKTYELWLIADDKKIPAGTFDVNSKGAATLLGSVPPLSKDAKVVLAVTDEPAGPMQQAPTGTAQIVGPVQ